MSLADEARLMVCAVQLLTRAPTPRLRTYAPDWTARAARYFPLVGEGVGAVSATAWLLAGRGWGYGVISAVMATALSLLLTGALHEDGLADCADGLGGGRTPAERLAIMKDSRIGTYGVLALGVVMATRVAALASLAPWRGAAALILAHGGGRAAAAVMAALPYAGDPDRAKLAPAGRPVTRGEAAVAVALGLWPLLPAALSGAPIAGLGLGLGLAIVATAILARTAGRLIGGYTGDVLGAAEQLTEASLLLGVVAFAHV